MFHRTITAIVFSAVFAAGLGLSAVQTAHAEGEEEEAPSPCKAKTFEIEAVKKACEKGGTAEVKKMMKEAVKKAKAKGEEMNCKTCHESTKEFEKHTKDAVAKLKPLL